MRPVDIIAKLRREEPGNALAMALCASYEALLAKKLPMTRAEIQRNYRARKKAKAEQD